MGEALISEARKIFHRHMMESSTLTVTKESIASNADSASVSSRAVALRTARQHTAGQMGNYVFRFRGEQLCTVRAPCRTWKTHQQECTACGGCVYHFALHELEQAVNERASDDSSEMLHTLIDGKRLKDISDLPLDLAV